MLREAAEWLAREGCREDLGAPTHDKCWKPADFVLWGKLFKPEALGPRCYDHAAKHAGHGMLARRLHGSDGFQLEAAILDLRPLRAALHLDNESEERGDDLMSSHPEQSNDREPCAHLSPRNYDRTSFSVCGRPRGHDGQHEDSEGRVWTDRTMPYFPKERCS